MLDKIKQKRKITNFVKDTQTTSLYVFNESSFDNRVFRCLIISSTSQRIHDFQSIKELLKTLRDVIKMHRFLYFMSNILHRNISENNIIITDSKKANDFMNMLIDLNLVKKIDSKQSNARHQTNIMKFMMIQVLHNVSHIYRHDLESFFYVLLWICNHHAWNTFESWFEE